MNARHKDLLLTLSANVYTCQRLFGSVSLRGKTLFPARARRNAGSIPVARFACRSCGFLLLVGLVLGICILDNDNASREGA